MNDRALERLFRRFRDRNDGAALAAVFDATANDLLRVACHLIRDPVEAEDLVQATFLTAIRKAETYDGSSPLKGWLYGILWREAAKSRRASARSIDPRRLAERTEPEPIDQLVAQEIPAAVNQALAKLPARYREVLSPLLREGQLPEEIAARLSRSPGTVRSQIHRGMERLRRALPAHVVPVSGVAGMSIRGLTKVRSEVLEAAGFSPTVAAAAPALALSATIGGLLMSKVVLVVAGSAIVLAAAAWFAVGDGGANSPPKLASHVAAASTRDVPDGDKVSPAKAASGEVRTTVGDAAPTAPSEASLQEAIDYWLGRFGEAPDSWRHGWAVAAEIAKLPPDEALRIMTAVWPKLSVPVKEQALKPFTFHGGHVHALKILHLAATDPALSVQGRAFNYLKNYAFQDFANDYGAYERWAATYKDAPVAEVLTANARRCITDMLALSPAEIAQRLSSFGSLELGAGDPAGVDLAAVMRDAGALQVLSSSLQAHDPDTVRKTLAWSKTLKADENWLRTWVLAPIQDPRTDPRVVDASIAALGRPDCKWAREPLLEYLRSTSAAASSSGQASASTTVAARALAEIGDPAAIPAMIELIAADRSGALVYDVGYFGLARLTGVTWEKSYDGDWWLAWWDKNRERLPPEVQAITIRR